jgi:putative ABC transport system permease protein
MNSIRTLIKAPGFTIAALLSLTIGIGATSAIFGVANALLLSPLPYPHAGRLAMLWQRSPGLGVPRDWLSLGQYLDIKSENTVFDRVAAAIGASYNLTGTGTPERVDGVRMTSDLLPMLGAHAMLGHLFTAEDDQPGQPQEVVLTYGFWQRHFGADPSVIDKTLILNGTSMAIVGVLSPDFVFDKDVMPAVNSVQRIELVFPLPIPPSSRTNRNGEDFNVFASLKPNVSRTFAQAEMQTVAKRMQQDYPAFYPAASGLTISVVPLIDQVVGDTRQALYVLLGAVALLLAIACSNVAGLLVSRAVVREKELAIRAAIGADRRRLIRQLAAENLTLALASGILGLGVALGSVWLLRHAGPAGIPRLDAIHIDATVLAFTFAVSVLSTLVFGLTPALRASDVDASTVLKEGSRGSTMGRSRTRNTLITCEVALSLVLLIGAGLLVRSYTRVLRADPGFDPRNALSFRLSLPQSKYATPESVTNFYRALDQKLAALPGVEYVGSNYQLPLSTVSLAWEDVRIEGYVPKAAGGDIVITSSGYVSPDYFQAMGIPLAGGRAFNAQDNMQSPPVVIVDEALATKFWPDGAIGKRLRQGPDGPWRTVVGVVRDKREYQADAAPQITAYFPVEQYAIASRFVVVRTHTALADVSHLTTTALAAVHDLDPDLPAHDVSTMEQRLTDSLARRRLSMLLLATFAIAALILSAVGVYGTIAYWVSQRRREIGIRMALGATRTTILGLIAQEFGRTVGVGLVAGLLVAFALTRVMSSLLFGVNATDATTFSLVPLLMALIAAAAVYVPVRRAMRGAVIEALRAE